MSRLLVVATVAATATLALGGTSWAADRTHASEETMFASRINASRASAGLSRLTVNLQLTRVARGWSGRMAAARNLSHNPNMAAEVTSSWTRLGENVGYSTRPGASPAEYVKGLHSAFMNSPGHRANILGDFNQVGVGVRMAGDTMWVTVNFTKDRTVVRNATVAEARRVSGQVFAAAGRTGGRRARFVVVTSSRAPANAMTAAALAGPDAPLLFTHPATSFEPAPVLHPMARAEIDRVLGGRGTVYVVGARPAVSDRVVEELVSDGYTVKRLAGRSAPATAAKVARETVRRRGNVDRVVITGRDWRPSVAGAVWAARSGAPLLITGPKGLHPAARGFLDTYRPARRVVVGPRASVSAAAQRQAGARRVGGRTGPAVSVNVARRLWGRTAAANGDRWASAPVFNAHGWAFTLAHAPRSAAQASPTLLVGRRAVPAAVRTYLTDLRYGAGVSGRVTATRTVPRPVVNRVQVLVGAR